MEGTEGPEYVVVTAVPQGKLTGVVGSAKIKRKGMLKIKKKLVPVQFENLVKIT